MMSAARQLQYLFNFSVSIVVAAKLIPTTSVRWVRIKLQTNRKQTDNIVANLSIDNRNKNTTMERWSMFDIVKSDHANCAIDN